VRTGPCGGRNTKREIAKENGMISPRRQIEAEAEVEVEEEEEEEEEEE
jgi:hypothetical protein